MSAVNEKYMAKAIALAALADGRTHPNPQVGAVIVRSGCIIGEGFHRQAGLPHAEIEALAQAGTRAKDADLYVTLEPCCHYGKTPPCTDEIIRREIRRVIYGMRDPNPKIRGRGLKMLRDAGIKVIGPVCEKECRALNRAFIHWATTGRPYVIVKVGTTLDGKIADVKGRSRWITNDGAREYTHGWRARVDGIIVGRRTLIVDNPRLTVRLAGYDGPQPRPIILVGKGPLPRNGHLLEGGVMRPAMWVVPPSRAKESESLARLGHDVITCPIKGGRFDLPHLLRTLGSQGITSVMVEGGGYTSGAFLRVLLSDHCIVAVAPMLLGGSAIGWTDQLEIAGLSRAIRLDVSAVHRFGDNVVIEGEI